MQVSHACAVLLHMLQDTSNSTPPTKQLALHGRPAVDLTIPLQHPELSADPKLVCAVMQSCKAWRQAVQQCGACNTAMAFNYYLSLPQLRGFADWLVKHAPLVRNITANVDPDDTSDDESDYDDCLPSARDVGEAHQILLGALQSAAAGSRIAAA